MVDQEKVSIFIATHNNVQTIERSLNSVANGIRPADQIVIGDNDSTDGTYDKLCEILKAEQVTIDGKVGLPPEFEGKINDTCIKIFRKRLTTTSNTLNIAMQMKWQGFTIFGFMEPTSWYAPDKIANAIGVFASQPSVACVVSDCDNHYEDGRVERVFRSSFDTQRLLASFPYDRNFLIRPQIFPKLASGFNEQMPTRDDYELLMRISEIGLIYHTPAPLHNNIVLKIDSQTQKQIQQFENFAKELAAKRRQPVNG